jgi:hypothetical protein
MGGRLGNKNKNRIAVLDWMMGWRHALQFWSLDKVKQCKTEPWKYACNARLSYGNRNGKQETGMQNNSNCCAGQLWLLCRTTLAAVQDNSDCCAGQLTVVQNNSDCFAGKLWILCRSTLTLVQDNSDCSGKRNLGELERSEGQPWLLCRTTLTVAEKGI